ncbi:MAG: hypothetical protein KC431_25350, partial [Myxococcales bacterium]|nr:hypothetical protein [Myxococcales bacterium]
RGAAKTEQSDGQHPVHLPRAMVLGAWAAAAGCGFVGLWLAWHQGDGYIPLLGAAKDLALIDDPTKRGFADSFEEFGYQVFPFTGLIVVGLLSPGRARWPALWLGTALVMGSLWSLRYGPTPVPVVIPAALLATAATERLLDPKEPIAARRLLLCCAILAAMILGKDAGRTPAHVASPLLALSPLHFPAAHLHLDERLPALAKRFAALLLLAHFIAPPSLDQLRWREGRETPAWLRVWQRIEAVLDRLLTGNRERAGLDRARTLLPVGLLLLGLLGQSVDYGRGLLDDLGAELSIAGPMRRWDAGIHDGTIPHARLGLYRIDDPGLRHYGPGPQREEFLANRVDLDRWIYDDRPRTVLMRRSDLPGAYANARTHGEPFYVLDASHNQYVLVSNFLPPETDDQNPLKRFVVAESPQLANETLVAWDPYLELVGWEIEGPVHRGSKPVLHLEFRVQRPLPAGAKLYARLQKGKVSRVSAMPHELGGNGELPPNYWRAGDIIHDRIQLEVPWLEVMPGEHDLIVGMRRSETSNFRMTRPEGDKGEFGVVMKNTAHEFAVIGQVPISW